MFQWRRGEKACREVPFLRNAGNPKGPRASLSPLSPSRKEALARRGSRPLATLLPFVRTPPSCARSWPPSSSFSPHGRASFRTAFGRALCARSAASCLDSLVPSPLTRHAPRGPSTLYSLATTGPPPCSSRPPSFWLPSPLEGPLSKNLRSESESIGSDPLRQKFEDRQSQQKVETLGEREREREREREGPSSLARRPLRSPPILCREIRRCA